MCNLTWRGFETTGCTRYLALAPNSNTCKYSGYLANVHCAVVLCVLGFIPPCSSFIRILSYITSLLLLSGKGSARSDSVSNIQWLFRIHSYSKSALKFGAEEDVRNPVIPGKQCEQHGSSYLIHEYPVWYTVNVDAKLITAVEIRGFCALLKGARLPVYTASFCYFWFPYTISCKEE